MQRREGGRVDGWIDGVQVTAALLGKEGIKSRRKVWEGVSCLELQFSTMIKNSGESGCGDSRTGLNYLSTFTSCLSPPCFSFLL